MADGFSTPRERARVYARANAGNRTQPYAAYRTGLPTSNCPCHDRPLSRPLLRPQLFHVAAVAVADRLHVGPARIADPDCPTDRQPNVRPTPTGSPSPTPARLRRPSPTFNPEQIEHPTGANDIVLRMEQGGGFVPFELRSITQSPQFTLYGDGTVIFQPIDNRREAGSAIRPISRWLGRPHRRGERPGAAAVRARHRPPGERQGDLRQPDDRRRRHDDLHPQRRRRGEGRQRLRAVRDARRERSRRGRSSRLQPARRHCSSTSSSRSRTASSTDVAPYEPELYRVVHDARASASRPASRSTGRGTTSRRTTSRPATSRAASPSSTRSTSPSCWKSRTAATWASGSQTPDGDLVQFGVRPLLPDEDRGRALASAASSCTRPPSELASA